MPVPEQKKEINTGQCQQPQLNLKSFKFALKTNST